MTLLETCNTIILIILHDPFMSKQGLDLNMFVCQFARSDLIWLTVYHPEFVILTGCGSLLTCFFFFHFISALVSSTIKVMVLVQFAWLCLNTIAQNFPTWFLWNLVEGHSMGQGRRYYILDLTRVTGSIHEYFRFNECCKIWWKSALNNDKHLQIQ